MSFRISGLDPAPFRALYGLSDAALAAAGVERVRVDVCPGFPDRVELRDGAPGEHVLLLNFVHQPADTPYRASHAIFVLEGAEHACILENEVPEALRPRTISLRAFDVGHRIVAADLCEGEALPASIERLFDDPAVAYLQAHYAKYGCYAARVERT